MQDVKDTLRALVRLSYDGRVFKTFRGPKAQERFENEVRVLRHLAASGCDFVPQLLAFGVRHDDANIRNITYRPADGRFCLIDFEFATLLPGFENPPDGTAQ